MPLGPSVVLTRSAMAMAPTKEAMRAFSPCGCCAYVVMMLVGRWSVGFNGWVWMDGVVDRLLDGWIDWCVCVYKPDRRGCSAPCRVSVP